MNEEQEEIDINEVMANWTEGIKNNTLPIESILVLERLFRFLINDYGPVIIATICQNELQLFEQMTAVPEIKTEEE